MLLVEVLTSSSPTAVEKAISDLRDLTQLNHHVADDSDVDITKSYSLIMNAVPAAHFVGNVYRALRFKRDAVMRTNDIRSFTTQLHKYAIADNTFDAHGYNPHTRRVRAREVFSWSSREGGAHGFVGETMSASKSVLGVVRHLAARYANKGYHGSSGKWNFGDPTQRTTFRNRVPEPKLRPKPMPQHKE